MRTTRTQRIGSSTRSWSRRTPLLLVLTAGLLATFSSAGHAGVRVGIAVSGPGFAFSAGINSYPVYSPAWNQASMTLTFDNTLSGYGEWIDVSSLGRVWHPWVAPDWRPYTWGRWVYTSYGWTWVAYEPWGYIPHHYGSWAMTSYGWVWVPGYTYRPAHVTWVRCGGYVGWYPAGPPGWSQARRTWWNGYRAGHRDGYRTGYRHGYADGWQDARYATFVPWNRMTSENISSVAVPGTRLRELNPTSVRLLRAAPSRLEVQRISGRRVATIRVSERKISMAGRSVQAVRPVGVERSIGRYSRMTIRGALLSPTVARTRRSAGRSVAPRTASRISRSRAGSSLARVAPEEMGRPARTAHYRSRPERSARGAAAHRTTVTASRRRTSPRAPDRSAGTAGSAIRVRSSGSFHVWQTRSTNARQPERRHVSRSRGKSVDHRSSQRVRSRSSLPRTGVRRTRTATEGVALSGKPMTIKR